MRTEDVEFISGPLDGRVLPIVLGMTGNPPKYYTVPVPAPVGGDRDGGEPTVLLYRRVLAPTGRRAWIGRWRYEFDPTGELPRRGWPWTKPRTPPAAPPAEPPAAQPPPAAP